MTNLSLDTDLRDLYQDLILDHGKRPHNFHVLEGANHEALGHNPLCGDRLMLYLAVDEDKIVRDAAFQGSGCAISVASASMMTDMVKGKTLPQIETLFNYMHKGCTGEVTATTGLDPDDVSRLQALSGVRHYPMRVKCATLPWTALIAALDSRSREAFK